jgi:hypothetical protein
MKNPKLPISLLLLIVLGASCKKSDFQDDKASSSLATTNTVAVANPAVDSIGWNSSAKWDVAKQDNYSVYYFNIKDDKITDNVAENGLVLVYKKNGSSVSALPVEEKGTGSSSMYWYHQITEGNIMITVDAYGTSTEPASANTFKYFVITPEQLKSLEAKSYNAASLMNLSYNEVKSVLASNK